MGIYDREYYRRDGPGFLGGLGAGQACKWLIAANVMCFIFQLVFEQQPDEGGARLLRGGNLFTEIFLLNVDQVLHGQVWRLLTYAFLHDPHNLWHIVFNMLFLWWFGKDLEGIYGTREFLTFYLVAAVIGGLAFTLAGALHLDEGAKNCLGASGSVTAVLVLCALHFPNRIILLFFF